MEVDALRFDKFYYSGLLQIVH